MMKTESFTNYMSRVIENLKKEERYGTAYIYSYALKALRIYKGKNDLPFSVFNKMEMTHFEQYLLNNKRSWNTISTYFRALRCGLSCQLLYRPPHLGDAGKIL